MKIGENSIHFLCVWSFSAISNVTIIYGKFIADLYRLKAENWISYNISIYIWMDIERENIILYWYVSSLLLLLWGKYDLQQQYSCLHFDFACFQFAFFALLPSQFRSIKFFVFSVPFNFSYLAIFAYHRCRRCCWPTNLQQKEITFCVWERVFFLFHYPFLLGSWLHHCSCVHNLFEKKSQKNICGFGLTFSFVNYDFCFFFFFFFFNILFRLVFSLYSFFCFKKSLRWIESNLLKDKHKQIYRKWFCSRCLCLLVFGWVLGISSLLLSSVVAVHSKTDIVYLKLNENADDTEWL